MTLEGMDHRNLDNLAKDMKAIRELLERYMELQGTEIDETIVLGREDSEEDILE